MEQNGAHFQPGGAVSSDAIYIEREADALLFQALLRGELCYILAPRQMGKTSLCDQVAARLQMAGEGVRCVRIDLAQIGATGVSVGEWFDSLILLLADELKIPEDAIDPHETVLERAPVLRWTRFLKKVVPAHIPERIVIFIDEIDTVLALGFPTDDLFAEIRSLHLERTHNADLNRLTFCLVGLARKKDLIQDSSRTPFNIGTEIPLADFTPEEVRAFLRGLRGLRGAPALLEAIFYWTNGHPYLTQLLCSEVCSRALHADGAADAERQVRALVEEQFLKRPWSELNVNLTYAARYVLDQAPGSGSTVQQRLELYRRVLEGEDIPARSDDPVQLTLRLAGMVAERREGRETYLRVRNRIFSEVFHARWIRSQTGERPYADALHRWLQSGKLPEYLLQGQALSEAEDWMDGRDDLTREETDFVRNSEREERRSRQRAELEAQLHLRPYFPALDQWRQSGRDARYLLSGHALAEAERSISGQESALSEEEREFLRLSSVAERRRETKLRQQAEAQNLSRRRFLQTALVAGAALGAAYYPGKWFYVHKIRQPIPLSIVHEPTLEEWLKREKPAFEERCERRWELDLRGVGSSDAMWEIYTGKKTPALWIVSDRYWCDRLNFLFRRDRMNLYPNARSNVSEAEDMTPLYSTRLALMLWGKPCVRSAVGEPDRASELLSYRNQHPESLWQVLERIAQGGWSAIGGAPGRNELRLAHSDVTLSNSATALLALLFQDYQRTHPGLPLTQDCQTDEQLPGKKLAVSIDAREFRERFRSVERAAAPCGFDTTTHVTVRNFLTFGLNRADMAVVYEASIPVAQAMIREEKIVLTHALQTYIPDPKIAFVLTGMVFSRAPWIQSLPNLQRQEQIAGARAFLEYFRSPEVQQRAAALNYRSVEQDSKEPTLMLPSLGVPSEQRIVDMETLIMLQALWEQMRQNSFR
ncbi:MAG TPA: AAA-like domain-containing protein [Chthonomonadaceae bacterium]|nr:AAA-like domain-containing protein [Chthonomonadaceae bacterium]